MKEMLLPRLVVLALLATGWTVAAANGLVTSDAAGKHPVTIAQAWGL